MRENRTPGCVRGLLGNWQSYSWVGSDVVMTLTMPSGRMIGRDTFAPDVIHGLGAGFETYTILNPEPGVWEVTLFGADVPPEGEEVVLSYIALPESGPVTYIYLPLVLWNS